MKVFSRSDAMFLGVLVGLALIAGPDSALAQTATFQPLNTALTSVLQFMTGTFATTAATVAVAAVGYLALTSRIPWSWAFSVIVGVALIFGAAQIVQSLTNGQG
ncbi:TrbC/VirB2 family protein [Methylocystis parvus]|jgi:type IV secretion system protein VirB2|uniref:TrbC/VirB2 family protein n=1 Tax=Methylocystis parvus TaxID=134 RepID=A0A6B8M495_9HYPH|nr:TrbC/VirB2 family protein [Methylocystis parvus]QGM99827.1 TrbC/VirB2 family protein [Methylocystis parvus]WBK02247.1 TrbC/VirB2 family protein [Methylocystis parvus OBBP]